MPNTSLSWQIRAFPSQVRTHLVPPCSTRLAIVRTRLPLYLRLQETDTIKAQQIGEVVKLENHKNESGFPPLWELWGSGQCYLVRLG